MKKLMMAVAAIVGLGLGLVHAEDIKVYFDGKAMGVMSFMEAIKAVDVSQSDKNIKPVPEKAEHAFPDLPCALVCFPPGKLTDDCQCSFPDAWFPNYCPSIPSSGVYWWTCPDYFEGNPNNSVADGTLSLYKSIDQATIKRLAGHFMAQDELRKILLAYFNAHNDFSSNIFQSVQDAKTIILYDDKCVYLINGKTLSGISDKELVKKVGSSSINQTKFGWVDGAAALVAGCVFSSECREDVADYVNGLHDDEHDTYHNNHDGSNPNYEVNKKVK